MAALRQPRPPEMTVEAFLAWTEDEPSGRRWQLIDGEPVAMAPPSPNHAIIVANITGWLWDHFRRTGSPCRVLSGAGVVPRLNAGRNFRVPDLSVSCAPPDAGRWVAAPTVLVEVLSPGNRRQTRANIWSYTTIESVRDILLVHGTRIEAELFRRSADGSWPDIPATIRDGGMVDLASIGFSTALHSFYVGTTLLPP